MPKLTPRQAVAALNKLDGKEPETQHLAADEILLDAMPPSVRRAYDRLSEERATWWTHS